MLKDLISLIYPRHCAACGASLLRHEEGLCSFCYINLPKTQFHRRQDNPLKAIFYGRVELETAGSYYYFQKKGSVQELLHAIKYKGREELAVQVGSWYAEDLLESEAICRAACLVPVPLHRRKLRQRGYNQSEAFARGLSAVLKVPVNLSLLRRVEFTASQTRKSRFERWENVEDTFEALPEAQLENRSVILVDDVITTGATIEACCLALKQIPGIRLQVLSIAYAGS